MTVVSSNICKRLVSRRLSKSFGCSPADKTHQTIGTVGWDLCRSHPSHRTSMSSKDCGARDASLSAESGRRTTRFQIIWPILFCLVVIPPKSSSTSEKSQDRKPSSWLTSKYAQEPRSCFNRQKRFDTSLCGNGQSQLDYACWHDLVNTLPPPSDPRSVRADSRLIDHQSLV